MRFEAFEDCALDMWESIPARFRRDIQALVIHRDPKEDLDFPGVYLMGECEVDAAVSAIPDAPVRSIIHLYHGSFRQIAAREDAFDWEGELWETITHELRHHLEWCAGVDYLGDEDDLQKENLARLDGQPFDVDFYRRGAHLGDGVYTADGELFIEVRVPRSQWRQTLVQGLTRPWDGLTLHAPPCPEATGAVVFIPADIDFPEGDPEGFLPWRDVTFVLRRKGLFF